MHYPEKRLWISTSFAVVVSKSKRSSIKIYISNQLGNMFYFSGETSNGKGISRDYVITFSLPDSKNTKATSRVVILFVLVIHEVLSPPALFHPCYIDFVSLKVVILSTIVRSSIFLLIPRLNVNR